MLFFRTTRDIKRKKQILLNSREIVRFLSVDIGDRSFARIDSLLMARDYIKRIFSKYGYLPCEQSYIVNNKKVYNISVEKKGSAFPQDIILIGAHYDTVEGTPGADDNATAIAALLELARLFADCDNKKTVRFTAFTLEEPPYYKTSNMGSRRYAQLCSEKNENIELMLCLEMLGYGGKQVKQEFPVMNYSGEKPESGDFLTVVSLPSMSAYVRTFEKIFNSFSEKKIYSIVAPASVPGIDMSDHASFITEGYPAIMLTDTAFYRNKNYHASTDSFDTINFRFLRDNIYSIFRTVQEISCRPELLAGIKALL